MIIIILYLIKVIQKDLLLVYLIGGHCAPNSTLGDICTMEKCSEYS